MPTFDIVNRVDMQEVDNAVNNTKKLISTRYDFKGSKTELKLDKTGNTITIITEDDMKLRAIEENLGINLAKRKVSPKAMKFKDIEQTFQKMVKREITIQVGIETDTCKKIVKLIKEMKTKVQASIQEDQVRVTGKKRDDLQEVIAMLKEQDLGIPLQYVNMKD